jgi:hypothetical protein
MNNQTIEIYDDLAGQALNLYTAMRIKQFCFEQATHNINEDFDQCYKRTAFLNFSYFSHFLNQETQNPKN